jgi:isoquinoline 1-oxidoreductase alpha subunit
MIELTINGTLHTLDVDPEMPLLWAIRDHTDLTGTKYSCGIGQCGACTVHLDGAPVRSCSLPVSAAHGKSVTTIEGLKSAVSWAIKDAWDHLSVVQCGYCQSGQIMSAVALLEHNPKPSDTEINLAMSGNLCRCASYARVHEAIKQAAAALGKEGA